MEEADHLHQPKYVLRGHASAIHALCFSPDNSRLLTGDSDGWIVSWSLAYKRPVASWRAHKSAVLGLEWWSTEAVISHGRDSKLMVWRLGKQDEDALSKTLPVDALAADHHKPDVLYDLTLNTMNFCSFASLVDPCPLEGPGRRSALLLAVPHMLDSEAIDIFHLPSTHRLGTVPAPKFIKAGMAMALCLAAVGDAIYLTAGYESGHVLFYRNTSRRSNKDLSRPEIFKDEWQCIYLSKPHSQPVLSLLASLDGRCIVSSGADSVIAVHALASLAEKRLDEDGSIDAGRAAEEPSKVTKVGDPGQQGLSTGWDGSLFAMAGWDGKARIYAWETLQRRFVLAWHRDGVYATAFAHKPGSIGSLPESKAENLQATSTHDDDVIDRTVTRIAPRPSALAERRERQAQQTSWVVVGGKDSKVSLWDLGQ